MSEASEYFRNGDDIHIDGECARSSSHEDREQPDKKSAAPEPAAAASAYERRAQGDRKGKERSKKQGATQKPGPQPKADGHRRGRPISAHTAIAQLRNAVGDHLSAIFLISKHGSPEKRGQAQRILDRYEGTDFSYDTNWDNRRSKLYADWDRMGVYMMSSFVYVERCYEAAQANLRKEEVDEKSAATTTKTAKAATAANKLKRKNPTRREIGQRQSGNLKSWINALKKARENYGLGGGAVVRKDSECYKEAKRLQREGT